jgi:phospho-N-acetylmuramoyl-pentapeptide-transferase
MLYNFLVPLADLDGFGFLNVFRYITFRTGGAMITALLIALVMGPPLIRWLRAKQSDGQPIRPLGPETHQKKAGTPTMGGLMILVAITLSTILWMDLTNPFVWLAILVMLGFGAIGFHDDYLKLTKRTHHGLSARNKLLAQIAIAALVTFGILQAMPLRPDGLATGIAFPFVKDYFLDLSIFFIVWAVVVMIGASNAVNLTDGLDGLATVPVAIAAGCFGFIAYLAGHAIYSAYLHIPYVPGTGELTILCGAIVGACLGFLWYNAPPAQVFMGDVGSLALGGVLGAMAVMTKHEIVLAIIGGLFVAETVSVMIQVLYFKATGKRFFRMAPIHHHFEKLGWPETTVVVRFWIIAIVLALIGLSTLKLR